MFTMKHVVVLAALLLLLASCTQQPDMTVIKKTIDDFNAAGMESMQTGETEAMMAFYADDAVSMPPNMEMCNGKAAIEDMMKKMSESGIKVSMAKFTSTDLGAGGMIAYDIGGYEMTMDIPEMGEITDKGNYVSIWKKHEDGSWKIHAEIWNSTTPIPGMEMEKMDMGKKK